MLGGKRVAGVLVVPDGASLPAEVPSIHFSDLKTAIDASNVESYERVLHPEMESREFGFAASVGSVVGAVFVTPPEVMRRRDVGAWRMTIDPSAPPPDKIERQPATGAAPAVVPLPARRYFLFISHAVPARPGTE